MKLDLDGTGRFLLHCSGGVELYAAAGPFDSYDELAEAAKAFLANDDYRDAYDNVFWASNYNGLDFGVFGASDLE